MQQRNPRYKLSNKSNLLVNNQNKRVDSEVFIVDIDNRTKSYDIIIEYKN